MGSFRKIYMVMKSSFSEWGKDVRVRIMFLMEAVLLVRYLAGPVIYGLKFHKTLTPFSLPILMTNSTVSNGNLKILLYLGVIMLFANAPFIGETTPYLMIRSKRSSWWKGECLYIWLASFLYLLFLTLFSMLITSPILSVRDLWGSLSSDIIRNKNELMVYMGNLIAPTEIMKNIYPHIAELLTFFAVWVSFVFLGHLMYAINLIASHSVVGVAAGVFFIMFAPIASLLGFGWKTEWLYWVSPINWSSIECWKIPGGSNVIPMWYALCMPLILTTILSILIGFVSKRKQIDILSMQ